MTQSRVIARRVGKPRGGNRSNTVAFPTNLGLMADEATRDTEENTRARKRVRDIGASLITRGNKETLATFDEGKGSSGYARWRRQLRARAWTSWRRSTRNLILPLRVNTLKNSDVPRHCRRYPGVDDATDTAGDTAGTHQVRGVRSPMEVSCFG